MSTQIQDKASKHDSFIAEQLRQAERRIRWLDLLTAGAGWLAGSLAYLVIMMLADLAFQLSAATRQTFFLIYLLVAAVYLYFSLVRPLRWRVNPYFAARQIEQTLPGNRNRILNWLDLREASVPGLIRSALGQRAARDLSHADLEEAISNRRALLTGSLAGFLLVVLLVLLFIFRPTQFGSLLARAVSPFATKGGIATQTQVRIVQPQEGDTVVTIGSPVTIIAEVSGRRPSSHEKDAPCLHYRHDPSEPYRKRFLQHHDGEWYTTISPLDVGSGFTYKVTAGDGETPVYRVAVRATPLIEEFVATYHSRPYMQRPPRSRVIRKLEDVRGVEVQILARTNRELKDGKLEFQGEDGIGDVLIAQIHGEDSRTLRFRLVLDRSGKYRIRFNSTDGEAYVDPIYYEVKVLADRTPEVKLIQPGKDIELPVNSHVTVVGEAVDDFGIAAMKLRVQVVDGESLQAIPYLADKLGKPEVGTPQKVEYRDILAPGSLKTEKGQPFAPRPGMQLEYWLEASDACDQPRPNVGASPRYRITLTEAASEEREQKKQQEARQQQQRHEQEQTEKLQNEKQQRDQEQKNEQGGGSGKEQDPKNQDGAGKEQDPKNQDGASKEQDPNKNDQGSGQNRDDKNQDGNAGQNRQEQSQPGEKQGEPRNDGQGRSQKDQQTQEQAEKLKNALDRRENQSDKGGQRANSANPDNSSQGENGEDPSQGNNAANPDKKPNNNDRQGNAGESANKGKEKSPTKSQGNAGKLEEKKPDEGQSGSEKKPNEQPQPGEAKESKTEGKPQGQDHQPMNKEGMPGQNHIPDEQKQPQAKPQPSESKDTPKEGQPGECKNCPNGGQPGADGSKPGQSKEASSNGSANSKDPRQATPEDVKAQAQRMNQAEGQGREKARRELQEIADKANDPKAREAARQALQQAKNDDPGTKQGEAQGAQGEKSAEEVSGNQAQGNPGGKPGEGNQGDRRDSRSSNDEKEQPARPERAAQHRPSMLQLEEFRKKVDADVLKEANMSREQFEKFLKDYADLARRTGSANNDPEVIPDPRREGGMLPNLTSKPTASKQPGREGAMKNEGRSQPPPEYREAYLEFLDRLKQPVKKKDR